MLDIDDTLDRVHGQQQLALFNAHYDERCFLPIHIYEGTSGKLVTTILRAGKTPGGEEVRTVLKHVIKRIRQHWPSVSVLVRGDSHYGRPEAMAWCESNGVDYIFRVRRQPGASCHGEALADELVCGVRAAHTVHRRWASPWHEAPGCRRTRRYNQRVKIAQSRSASDQAVMTVAAYSDPT